VADVLVPDRVARGRVPGGGSPVARAPLTVLALGLAIVGVADAALVWYPPEVGNAQWEFTTITRTFNGLALATIGIGGLAALAIASARRGLIAVLSALCTLAAIAIMVAGVLYLMSVPVALGAAPAALADSLTLAIGKTLLYIVVYLAVYGFLTVYGWRRFNALAERP
jgi:hypothetical protein